MGTSEGGHMVRAELIESCTTHKQGRLASQTTPVKAMRRQDSIDENILFADGGQ